MRLVLGWRWRATRTVPTPWGRLRGAFFGGVFFILLGAAMAVVGATSTLSCTRESGEMASCSVEWRALLGRIALRRVTVPRLEAIWSERLQGAESQLLHYVLFGAASGPSWLPPLSDEVAADAAVARVRAFIDARDEERLEARFVAEGYFALIGRLGDVLIAFGLLQGLVVLWRLAGIVRAWEERQPA